MEHWDEQRDLCRIHGIEYPGSGCPICAIDAVLGSTQETQHPHDRPDRNASGMQANWTANHVYGLQQSSSFDEALCLARKTLAIDRSNIRAYIVSANALERMGLYVEAKRVYLKQIDLLRLGENGRNYLLVKEVLQELPLDDALLRPFSRVVSVIRKLWDMADKDCAWFLKELVDRRLLPFEGIGFTSTPDRE